MTITHPVVLLPGIIAPVAVRYGPLVEHLGGTTLELRELAVYATDAPPSEYTITTELDALDAAADFAGLDRFHVYAHSGGGAVALAYAAARGDRLISLAVDEPASDFTPDGQAEAGWPAFEAVSSLPPEESTRVFLQLQVADDVVLPDPPPGPPPPWMALRHAGIQAFTSALRNHHVAPEEYAAFGAPVYFSRGSRTHPRWAKMQDRLAALFPDFTGEVYEGLHHLNTSHMAEPARVAVTLARFWERSEGTR